MKISTGQIIFITIVIAIIGLILSSNTSFRNYSSQPTSSATTSSQITSTAEPLGSIPQVPSETKLYIDKRLKNTPIPTNKIWSAIPFSGTLNTLFLYPLAVKMINGEIVISKPETQVNEKSVVTDTSKNTINIRFTKSVSKVELYDFSDLTVTVIGYDADQQALFKGTFVQGSPYIFFEELNNNKANVYSTNLNFSPQDKRWEGKNIYFELNNDPLQAEKDGNIFLTPTTPNFTVAFYSTPNAKSEVMEYAANIVTAVKANFSMENNTATTRYEYSFASNKPEKTFFGLLPNHSDYSSVEPSFTIPTIRGEQKMVKIESTLTSSLPEFSLQENLPFKGTAEDKKLILDNLKTDSEGIKSSPVGSYFGAKYLARTARLIQIADSIEAFDIKQNLVVKLKTDLEDWLSYQKTEEEKYFLYDTTVGSLIAQKPEFGSDSYNDHHFHYGYFIYAAAVLAKEDKQFLTEYRKTIDLIIADIALSNKNDQIDNINFSSLFPTMRVFDFYEGHSWASGTAPFLDGNNQESSSEALNAWYAIWLWGKVTESDLYTQLGSYLFSTELNSTNNYWFAVKGANYSFPSGYKNSIASIVWGGKVDFATWFSSQPLDIYGIQFIPFTPASTYLINTKRLASDEKLLQNALNYREGKLLDIVLMYLGTDGGRKNISKDVLNSVFIDDGNTKTNLLFWLIYNENRKV